MKIIVVSRDLRFKGGVVNFARLLMKGLKEDGHDVIHFVEGKKPYGRNLFMPLTMLFQYRRFSRLLSKEKPDIVHLNPSMGRTPMWRDGIFLRIAKKKGAKLVVSMHGWDETYFRKSVKKGLTSIFHRNTLKLADHLILSSPRYEKMIFEYTNKKEYLTWIPTMVETEKYMCEKKYDGKPILLFCGRLVEDKGVYEAFEAFVMLKNDFPNLRMIFMGDGAELTELKKRSARLGLGHHVVFTGFLRGKEKYEIFGKSHILVFPSYHEGFPTVIPESMAAGMVPIMTPVGGLPYILEDKYHGLFLSGPPPNPFEIYEKTRYLFENPEALRRISERNASEAVRLFDYHSLVRKIEELYEKLLHPTHR